MKDPIVNDGPPIAVAIPIYLSQILFGYHCLTTLLSSHILDEVGGGVLLLGTIYVRSVMKVPATYPQFHGRAVGHLRDA